MFCVCDEASIYIRGILTKKIKEFSFTQVKICVRSIHMGLSGFL